MCHRYYSWLIVTFGGLINTMTTVNASKHLCTDAASHSVIVIVFGLCVALNVEWIQQNSREFIINTYTQTARWKITRSRALSITTKFIPQSLFFVQKDNGCSSADQAVCLHSLIVCCSSSSGACWWWWALVLSATAVSL